MTTARVRVFCLGVALLALACSKGHGGTTGTGGNPGTGGSPCSGTQTACGTDCIDTSSDPTNCGGCGIPCSTGQICQNGACQCQSGFMLCNGSCVASDATHCGSCSMTCQTGQVCSQRRLHLELRRHRPHAVWIELRRSDHQQHELRRLRNDLRLDAALRRQRLRPQRDDRNGRHARIDAATGSGLPAAGRPAPAVRPEPAGRPAAVAAVDRPGPAGPPPAARRAPVARRPLSPAWSPPLQVRTGRAAP